MTLLLPSGSFAVVVPRAPDVPVLGKDQSCLIVDWVLGTLVMGRAL